MCLECEAERQISKAAQTYVCGICLDMKPQNVFSEGRFKHRTSRDLVCLECETAVHICYGYGIKANTDWNADTAAKVE